VFFEPAAFAAFREEHTGGGDSGDFPNSPEPKTITDEPELTAFVRDLTKRPLQEKCLTQKEIKPLKDTFNAVGRLITLALIRRDHLRVD
jgi:hypothetical protein